ncbi:Fic family protein [Mucilaginibacter sp. SJ]|uniref:Fic family protein n=1 Tax=Mucilaginibacter sp. SJ TaxID=3029053 RepID=UPI0023A97ABC|nr:Fic family protein [Mucilaginibacter sp. SJ]WEA01053.1 Fic family protein [Mucilaginibacter sp. SJ]
MMNLKLEIEFSKAPILLEIDSLKKQIDDMRPLPPDVEGRVMQKLRLDWNYNSNAIEGNKLSYGETTALLMHGITAKGKPLKDHLDIQGHNQAVEYLERLVKDGRDFTESDIRALHEVLLVKPDFTDAQTAEGLPTRKRIEIGKYKSLPNHVKTRTGEIHYYATPEETPALMNDLMAWYVAVSENTEIHPVIIAALFHHTFVAIHPFDDGNGRMARILMNLILMKSGYPVVVIKDDTKDNYYSLLSQADVGDSWPFVEFAIERLQNSMQLYLKAIKGGDIDEDEDIDKEIALLKLQLNGRVVAKEKKSTAAIERVFNECIYPLARKISDKFNAFNEYFFSHGGWFTFEYIENNRRTKYDHSIYAKIETLSPFFLKKDMFIKINVVFQEYRDPDNTFNMHVILNVLFEEFYYKISVAQNELVSKLYHEKIIVGEESKIIRMLIDEFKKELQEKLKSPKS